MGAHTAVARRLTNAAPATLRAEPRWGPTLTDHGSLVELAHSSGFDREALARSYTARSASRQVRLVARTAAAELISAPTGPGRS
jgi:hypothetical protein